MVTLKEETFGHYDDETVKKFTWTNENGFSVSAISYGAIVTSIKTRDSYNNVADVALGFDDLESYIHNNIPYFGAIVGRCANRIGGGKFELDGRTYQLAQNIGIHHLHGGIKGFDKVNWKTSVQGTKVTFSYLSVDGEENYPGDLQTNVTYEVTKDNALRMDMTATTTKKTIVNLTNHSYFNLAGHNAGADELYKHIIRIGATHVTETDENSIPTGKLIPLEGNFGNVSIPNTIGSGILGDKTGQKFDENYCLAPEQKNVLRFVARVVHPTTGRNLEVYSDQPGVQFYTGNFIPLLDGKGGSKYSKHGGFCLETQNYPDAIHHSNFPTPILNRGEVYKHTVEYYFGHEDASKISGRGDTTGTIDKYDPILDGFAKRHH